MRLRRKISLRSLARSGLIVLLALCFSFSQLAPAFAADAERENRIKNGPWWYPDECTQGPEAAPGIGDPNGIIYPNLDATNMAAAIEKYIEETFPASPFKGTGALMVTTGHEKNVSPFLFVALASKESSLGTNGDLINKANNGFGRKASERQPNIVGSDGGLWYKWASVAASVDINDPSHAEDPSQSGDMGSYLRAIAAYQPAFKNNSLVQLLNKYAPQSDGNDTGGYISFAQGIIDKLANYAKGPTDAPDDADSTTDAGSTSSFCTCDPNNGAPTIALDAGHVDTGNANLKEETVEGISAKESNNMPEAADVWEITENVQKQLQDAGYNVVLTKKALDESISLFERARRANRAQADLAVSIHYDAGRSWSNFAWVTPQSLTAIDEEKGENTNDKIRARRYTGDKIKYFDEKENAQQIAAASQAAAQAMAETRTQEEGRPAVIHDLIFPKARGLQASGNISIVQLFANVPWVYNEVGTQGGFGANRKEQYAKGIAEGVKKAVPISSAQAQNSANGGDAKTNPGCAGNPGANGDAVAMALHYAWPTYRPPVYVRFKPTYRAAVDKAIDEGRYVGGGVRPGIDCGGFVSLVMQDSGADPDYNYAGKNPGYGNTVGQMQYLINHPDKYERINTTSTQDLQPGDIAFNSATPGGTTHTYMYVGKQPGFETNVASASWSSTGLSWRTPMAGHDSNGISWFRLKK